MASLQRAIWLAHRSRTGATHLLLACDGMVSCRNQRTAPANANPPASPLFDFCAERGWCERLVDIATPDSPLHLRMVLSPGPTPAARALLPRRLRHLPAEQQGAVQAIEVCPQVRWLLSVVSGSSGSACLAL